MLNPASFLQIALFKLRALFTFKAQTRIAQSSIHLALDLGAVHLLALAHDHPLLRSHLHPALGISPKDLSIFRRHCDPTLASIVQIRPMSWRGHSMRIGMGSALRLRGG